MKKRIAIIGGGPSALMLAAHLDSSLFDITLYERNNTAGRKFLVAGDGGLNITHSEPVEHIKSRYLPQSFMNDTLDSFSNLHLRSWLAKIGIETFAGSSKRVFPIKGIKPIEVLNAILDVIKKNDVCIKTRHQWTGWNETGQLTFQNNGNIIPVDADIIVFALGGGSWKKTGSDGEWTNLLKSKDISLIPFQPSNCTCQSLWKDNFIEKWEGRPLKNITIECGNSSKKGEIVITKSGIEGGAVYALVPEIRKQILNEKKATIYIDLKPGSTLKEIESILKEKKDYSLTRALEKDIKLSPIAIGLLKSILTKEEYTLINKLPSVIKRLPVEITGLAPLDEAISTAGGISLNEIDKSFQLKKLPGHYAIGEMLDWDAPTGGYLLQGCFGMGYSLAEKLNSSTTLSHSSGQFP